VSGAPNAGSVTDEISLSGLSDLSKTTSLKPPEHTPQILTPAQITSLAAIQDRLIPPEGDLPGAGESGAALRVDGLLAAQPNWRPDVLAALQAVDVASGQVHAPESASSTATGFLNLSPDARDAVLLAVEAAYPHLFARLLRVTYTAYYTDAAVQRARGQSAEPPLPEGYTLPTFDESRLEPVKRRGKLWRDA